MKKTPRATFKANEVELITGISVDVQKAWNKHIAKYELPRLGEGDGHRRYSWIDVCFLRLVDRLKARGLSLYDALYVALDQSREDLLRTFATLVVGLPTDSDVFLYVGFDGGAENSTKSVVSCRIDPDKGHVLGGGSLSVDDFIRDRFESFVAINLTLMTANLIGEIELGSENLDHLDDMKQFFELALDKAAGK